MSFQSFVFLIVPQQFRRRTTSASANMSLCRATNSKFKGYSKQIGLYFINLFLRLEDSIDKFFIRNLTVKMGLSHIVIYLEFGLLENLIAYPCPDVERRIPVVGYIDTDKFRSG